MPAYLTISPAWRPAAARLACAAAVASAASARRAWARDAVATPGLSPLEAPPEPAPELTLDPRFLRAARRPGREHPEPAILRRDPLAAALRAGGAGYSGAPARSRAGRSGAGPRSRRSSASSPRIEGRPVKLERWPTAGRTCSPRSARSSWARRRAPADPGRRSSPRAHPDRGLPRAGQDAHRPARRPERSICAFKRIQFTPDLLPATSPAASSSTSGGGVRVPARARSSPTCSWPTRSTGPRPRPRRAARGDAGAPGHRRRRDAARSSRRSWSSPPRTRSSWRGPIRCRRPSSTAS